MEAVITYSDEIVVKIVDGNDVTVELSQQGPSGPKGNTGGPGLRWIEDGWILADDYIVNDALYRNGTSYRAKVDHTAASHTEPGTGENWDQAWEIVALGAEVEHVDAILALADEIEAVAALETEVEILAGIASEIEAAVANEAAIQAAPGHAAAAAAAETNAVAARNKAEEWAENPEDDEVEADKYSSKHHALKAAASEASAAISAALEDAGVAIYHSTEIALGGYYMDIAARVDQEITDIYAKLLGSPGDEGDFYIAIDGSMVYGPVTVTYGTDLHVSELEIERNKGESLQLFITYKVGNPTDLMVKAVGHAQP